MEYTIIIRALLALAFVAGLIGLVGFVTKKFSLQSRVLSKQGKKRLSIEEILWVDAKTRIILLRRDDKTHLLLLSPHGATMIESDIPVSDV